MQASNLQFLDEHKEALQHHSREVRIEERATGDEHLAAVHPSILEEVLGELKPPVHSRGRISVHRPCCKSSILAEVLNSCGSANSPHGRFNVTWAKLGLFVESCCAMHRNGASRDA